VLCATLETLTTRCAGEEDFDASGEITLGFRLAPWAMGPPEVDIG
jgi:hypothetical protein